MQKLYTNGTILTMKENELYSEALLIKNGSIQAVGTRKDLEPLCEADCKRIDLQGACLMPSFIDAHSHMLQFANTLKFVPLKSCTCVADIQEEIKRYIEEKQLADGEWVMGFGYDHNALAEHRHPNCHELDAASRTHPIILAHSSFHMGVLNTMALQAYGLDDSVKNPEGGSYGRDEQGHLNGYMEEVTFMRGPGERVMSLENIDAYAVEAQKIYASFGITTAQEGFAHRSEVDIYERLGRSDQMLLDMVAYVDIVEDSEVVQQREDLKEYRNHFRIGGYKLFLDGSPQGKTAWMSKPYVNSGDYCGYPIYTDEQVDGYVQQALDEHRQLLVHCNGDAASQQMLNGYHHSRQKTTDTRPVMVHSQTLRPDQLPQLKETGVMPSYFVAHVYHWGDVHLVNFGKQRAENISCTASALKNHIPFTFHQDTPVILPDMLESVWAAVNRVTKNGVVLGEQQRISVLEALKAVTINAAYQYFEEDRKGTLEAEKLADLVLLNEDPLKAEPMKLRDIQVMETIKEGRTIYKKAA